ncbi:MAG TPA: amidohydrolase family protein [Steroidobacteraceae bacterium]|nr:amidohydrolase family protein [Steroidobacteraceae bacterium]
MKSLWILIAAATMSLPVEAQDLLIRDAKVHTAGARGTIEHADVLVRDQRIVAVGQQLSAAGARVIEARNRPLTPGFFAGVTAIGLMEVPAEPVTDDASISFGAPAWQQQWRPELDVTLAFNPRSTLVPVTRIEGLTWAMLTPYGDAIIGGQGGAVTLDGRYDAMLTGSRSLFVSWDANASGAAGSRATLYMLFEQAIREARAFKPPPEGALLHEAGREALLPYLAGGRTVFQVERAADIRQLIAFASRNGLRPVIVGGAEAWVVADELARARIPVILNPLDNLPSSFDQIGARLDNAVRLQRAGVRIAFSSGDIHNARKIRQLAGNAVAHGLPWEAALAAVTASPAEIFGLGARRGQIAAGQVADLVLWDGDPLEVTSGADQVWIAGREVAMQSRQTQLRDRYFERSPTDGTR